jgi:hypothetical protein
VKQYAIETSLGNGQENSADWKHEKALQVIFEQPNIALAA